MIRLYGSCFFNACHNMVDYENANNADDADADADADADDNADGIADGIADDNADADADADDADVEEEGYSVVASLSSSKS